LQGLYGFTYLSGVTLPKNNSNLNYLIPGFEVCVWVFSDLNGSYQRKLIYGLLTSYKNCNFVLTLNLNCDIVSRLIIRRLSIYEHT
jgi:hypothetical protein